MSTTGNTPSAGVSGDAATPADRTRQLAVTATFVLCVLANLVGSGVIGSREVSTANNEAFADDATLLTPAGSAFSVWSLIYLGLAAYVVLQWRPSAAIAARHRAIGWPVVIVSVLNAAWLQVTLSGYLWLSAVVIIGLLVMLGEILRRLEAHPSDEPWERWASDGTFGAYAGWVSIAVVANVAASAVAGGGDVAATGPTATRTAVVVLIGVAAACAIAAWAWGRVAVALTQTWGLLWLAYGRLVGEPDSTAVGLTAAAAACVPLLVVALRRTRPPLRGTP